MPASGKRSREELFSRYASNLSLYDARSGDIFVCPVCLKPFTRSALRSDPPALSLAHVIPEALGGRLVTLACAKCDNRIGSAYDSQAALEQELYRWQRGDAPIRGRLKHEGLDVAVEIERDGVNWHFRELSGQSKPKSFEQLMDVAAANWSKFEFSATIRTHSPPGRNVSLLYSAFLMMFRTYGYEYALCSNVDHLREILSGRGGGHNLERRIIPAQKTSSQEPPRAPSIGVLIEPKELRCFLVALPSPAKDASVRYIMLPGFGEDGKKAYEDILSLTEPFGQCRAKLILATDRPFCADSANKWLANWLWRNVH